MPPKLGMLPVEIPHLGLRHAGQLLLGAACLAPAVVPPHPVKQRHAHDEHARGRGQVETVANAEVRRVVGEVAPCRDEAADVAEHDWQGSV